MEIAQVACLKKVHDATLDEEFYCIQKTACLMKALCYAVSETSMTVRASTKMSYES